LVGVMHGLRDKGNTLVVVEHEQAVMQAADHIVDIGPGSGQFGGEVIYTGAPPEFASVQFSASSKSKRSKASSSLKTENFKPGTTPWLSGARSIAVPSTRRAPTERKLELRGATRHNLRKLDADIPLGLFVCLTGVSG